MNQWWSETVEGEIDEAGDEVKVAFPPFGHWRFRAVALERGESIEMLCIEARQPVEGKPREVDEEWLGTKIIWRFSRLEGGGEARTRVALTHEGLTPQLACWNVCLDGWNYFFRGSLKRLLDGGVGSPHEAP